MKKLAFFLFLFLFAGNALAFGPFYVFPDGKGGEPYKWKDNTLEWRYENNRFSDRVPLDSEASGCLINSSACASNFEKCGVLKCIEYAMGLWRGAKIQQQTVDTPTTSVKTIKKGSITPAKLDINGLNIATYVLPSKNNNVGYIIFDEDGDVFETLNKEPYSYNLDPDLIGITIPWRPSDVGGGKFDREYSGALMILNARYFNNDRSDGYNLSDQEMGATILHEIGHMLGLDHTQPLKAVMGSDPGDYPNIDEGMPTMYPIMVSPGQLSLHHDDMMGISYLYPHDDLDKKFCKVEGVLKDAATGKELQGANVIIHPSETDGNENYIKAASFVSGALYVGGKEKGGYVIPGLVPDVEYEGVVEAVNSKFKEGFAGGLNPYGNDAYPCSGPSDYQLDGDLTITFGGSKTVKCTLPDGDGVPPVINANKEIEIGVCEEGEDCGDGDSSDSKKKGWCMSIAGGVNPALSLAFVPAIALGLYVLRRRKNS